MPAIARIGQWRAGLSTEVGTNTEVGLSQQLLGLENETWAGLTAGLRNLPAVMMELTRDKTRDQRPDIRKTNTKSKVLASSRISEYGLLQGLYHAFIYVLTLLK